ncbi:MAG: hypothetical protein IKB35_04250 [Clostridia bacterium]|nr:hypothetical protein [Clostridia bacterium]
MKTKALSLLLLIAALLALASCTFNIEINNGGKNEPPYNITYTSKGDGTCSATVALNSKCYEQMDISIPDTSPDGDTVTDVSFTDNFIPLRETFPKTVSKETMEALKAQLEANLEDGKNSKIYRRIMGLYVLFDYSDDNTPPRLKEHMLEDYPYIEYTGAAYIFDSKASDYEIKMVADYIFEYTDLSPRKMAKDEIEKIRSSMKAAGVLESDFEYKIPADQQYSDGISSICINSLKLPSGIKSLNISSPKNFYLESITVPAGAISSIIEALAYTGIPNVYSLDTQPPQDFKLPEAVYKLPDGTVIPEEDYDNYSTSELEQYAVVTQPSVRWYQEKQPDSTVDYPAWRYVDGEPLGWNQK